MLLCQVGTLLGMFVRRGLSTTVTWFASPIVLGWLAILLLFCIVVLQSRVAKFSRDMHRLKEDFSTYRRGMKEKARAVCSMISPKAHLMGTSCM